MGKRSLVVAVLLAACSSKSSGPSEADCSAYVDHASALEQEGKDDYMPMFKYARSERADFLARCPKVLSKQTISCGLKATSLDALDACRTRREVNGAIQGDSKERDEAKVVTARSAAPEDTARIVGAKQAEEEAMARARAGVGEPKLPEPAGPAPSRADPVQEPEELRLVDGEVTGGTGCGMDACLSIRAITPFRGAAAGDELVEISGDLFSDRNVKVYFGGRLAEVVRVDAKVIVVKSPSGEPGQTVDVDVVFEPGGQLTIRDGFAYGDPLDDLDTE